MDIVIPTLGRAHIGLQATLNQVCDLGRVKLVVQPHEVADYAAMLASCPERVDIFVLPERIKGIAATRDYIIHDMPGDDHVVMLDDDLHFAVRRYDERTKFRKPVGDDLLTMLSAIDAELAHSPHVSIGAREGGNRVTAATVYNTRMMRVLAYRRSYLKSHLLAFHPMQVMEDFHMSLQIMRRGQDCVVLNNWVSNQAGGSDATGGCSIFRTPELQDSNARTLAKLHPGFVKVVTKATKTAWGGGERTDVVVQWKQAAAAGKKVRHG